MWSSLPIAVQHSLLALDLRCWCKCAFIRACVNVVVCYVLRCAVIVIYLRYMCWSGESVCTYTNFQLSGLLRVWARKMFTKPSIIIVIFIVGPMTIKCKRIISCIFFWSYYRQSADSVAKKCNHDCVTQYFIN